MDGSEGPRAQSTRAFARNLAKLTELPIALWDERLSTAAVERELIAADVSRKKRAAVIDQHAAIFILQGALDRLMHGSERKGPARAGPFVTLISLTRASVSRGPAACAPASGAGVVAVVAAVASGCTGVADYVIGLIGCRPAP